MSKWKFVKFILYTQMTLGSIAGILLILVRNDIPLGVGVSLMGVNGILLTHLYSHKEKR